MLNVLSLGAGRQSSAMALMAAHELITPMPDAAIFADTGDEPSWVYDAVAFLSGANVLPFPVITVGAGENRLGADLVSGQDMARIPYHVEGAGLGGRQCTRNYKLRPMRRAIRELLGVGPHDPVQAGAVSQWIGISRDEADRMKPNDVQYIRNRYPLIEKLWSVDDCVQWLVEHQYPVFWSSACVYCPLLSNMQRRRIRDYDPAGHERACQVDEGLRTPENIERFRGKVYVHRSRVPLRQANLEDETLPLFPNECEGMCGV